MAILRISSLLSFILVALLFLADSGRATYSKDIVVKSGQSIQSAIDHAECGAKITVQKGTYPEQLVISKDDITLIGRGAVITKPAVYKTNACTGLAGNETDEFGQQTQVITHAGICIIGKRVVFKEFMSEHKKIKTVGQYIKNVEVTGFEVNGFNGLNIVTVATKNARINKNKLVDGGKYGFLTLGSYDTLVEQNVITSTTPTFIALCMDDKSNVKIWNNHISKYFIGLCVQTNGADVKGNYVSETCYGAYVDPGIVGAKLTYNHISKTSPICGTFPFPATYGIIISGAVKTEVKHNYIQGITASGNAGKTGVGIGLYDNKDQTPAAIASGNIVKENRLKMNDLDIQVDTQGTGNVVKRNYCSSSQPAGACTS